MVKTVLIVGLGSIGQRYARLLRKIYGNEIELLALRERGFNFSINEDFSIKKINPEKKYNIKSFYKISKLKNKKISHAFICTPPSKHINDVIKILKFCSPKILIEKPITHDYAQLKKLKQKKYSSVHKNIFVSQQLRYSPLTEKLKSILNKNKLGKISYATFMFSEYLPLMHPYEDYRISHASLKKKGGGVVLNLNHDIDMMYYLFGMPSTVIGFENQANILKIDCEESANLVFKYKKSNCDFHCRVDLDFVGKPTKRMWSIVGEKGRIDIDLTKNNFHLFIHKKGKVMLDERKKIHYHRNDLFEYQIKQLIATKTKNLVTFNEACKVMNICSESKKSLKKNKIINIT